MKNIILIIAISVATISCKKNKDEECLKSFYNNEIDTEFYHSCKWLKDENNNYIINDDGSPIPNN
jgi:hypothetical protein